MSGYMNSAWRGMWFLVGLAALALAAPGRAEENVASSTVRVGIMRTAFRDAGRLSLAAQLQPSKALMDAQTGLESQLSVTNDADELGAELVDGKVEFGVVFGHELASARQKYPELTPLVVTVPPQALKAYLVVRSDS